MPVIRSRAGEALDLNTDNQGRLRVTSISEGAGDGAPYVLLNAAAATGSAVEVAAGNYQWSVWGTWNGATAQLQFSPNVGTTWIDFDGIALTSNGGWRDLALASGHYRVVISNAGGSTSLTSELRGAG